MPALVGPPALAASSTPMPSASALFRFADPRLSESSGLAASSFDDTVYTHNDSGDAARFYRVDGRGDTVAVYTLRGVRAVDWEDMASGTDADGGRVLYLADIGDNATSRNEIDVYRVAEPRDGSGDVAWVRYRFAYPDGPHDAEALLVNPRTQRMYVATKAWLGSGQLYAAPATVSTTAVNMLTPVRPVPALVTSGDFSPDGSHVVLLTYFGAYWADSIDGPLHAFAVPRQPQNEAIAFDRGGDALLVGSEGSHSTVYRVALPWADQPTAASAAASVPASSPPGSSPPGSSPPGSSTAASPAPTGSPLPQAVMYALAALGVVLAGVLLAAIVIRRRHG